MLQRRSHWLIFQRQIAKQYTVSQKRSPVEIHRIHVKSTNSFPSLADRWHKCLEPLVNIGQIRRVERRLTLAFAVTKMMTISNPHRWKMTDVWLFIGRQGCAEEGRFRSHASTGPQTSKDGLEILMQETAQTDSVVCISVFCARLNQLIARWLNEN